MNRPVLRIAPFLLVLASCGGPYPGRDLDQADEGVLPPVDAASLGLSGTYFEGFVVDPCDFYRPGARVRLVRLDPETGSPVVVQETQTGLDGAFVLRSPAAGRHIVSVDAGADAAAPKTFDVDAPHEERLRADFALVPVRRTLIQGVLLGMDGLPLTPDAVNELFDGGAPDPIGASSRYASDLPRFHGWFPAAVNPDNARFEIEVPAQFDGVVELYQGGRSVAQRPWTDGAGLLEFPVDLAAARAAREEPGILGLVPDPPAASAPSEASGENATATGDIRLVWSLHAGRIFRLPRAVQGRLVLVDRAGERVLDTTLEQAMDWHGNLGIDLELPAGRYAYGADFGPLGSFGGEFTVVPDGAITVLVD